MWPKAACSFSCAVAWLGVWALWLGAISDTKYFETCGILEFQKNFVGFLGSSVGKNLPFTNILDKGYWLRHPRSMAHWWTASASTFLCKK
jgi:hypothetical protein